MKQIQQNKVGQGRRSTGNDVSYDNMFCKIIDKIFHTNCCNTATYFETYASFEMAIVVILSCILLVNNSLFDGLFISSEIPFARQSISPTGHTKAFSPFLNRSVLAMPTLVVTIGQPATAASTRLIP